MSKVEEEEISIGVFGDSGIGKTTIIIQFLKSIFVEEHGKHKKTKEKILI